MTDIAIIGGGPAGFIAAISAAESNREQVNIDIYEKGEPLKTILWTGGGRCNLTNAIFNFKELAANYPRGEKFLYSVFSKFGVEDTMNWFKAHGIQLYTQDDNRVFPRSDDANTVRDMLINKAKDLGINIKSRTQVLDVEYTDGKFKIYFGDSSKAYDRLIISTGGNYRKLPDSGYDFARKLGHSVSELRPSLNAYIVKEIWPAALAGVTVKNAEIKAFYQDKQVAKALGDFIFTHKGISGPLIFKISSYCAFLDINECSPIILKINFVPQYSQQEFEADLLKELDENSKKSIVNILTKYAAKSVILALLGTELIDPEKKASQITRDDRKVITRLMTELELSAESLEQEGEIVTAGGVELNQVDSKTMESKLLPGLYFCGEVLNIDGLTGGFNLQACWSTGHIAGVNAARE